MKKKVWIAFVLTLGLSACGQKMESTVKPETTPSAAIPNASNGQKPQPTLPSAGTGTAGDAASTLASYPFFGAYSGSILHLADGVQISKQLYTLTIGKTPVPGSSDIYVTMELAVVGNAPRSSYLGVITGASSGSYIFVSQPFTMAWSNRTQVAEIYLSFSGNTLVKDQSRIYMRECGFSDSTLCTNLSSDIGFGLDLSKQ